MACAQIEENDPGKGYLSFGSLSIDAKVEGLQLTKASVPPTEIPTADQFTYTIINKEDGLTYYENVGLPVEVIPLPIGPYKVQVSYGANEFGRPYYFASNDNVTIKEDETTALNFSNIPLANAMVAVTLPDMTGHMSVSSISLSLSDGSSIPIKSGEYNFAPSGKEVFASFAGKNALGEDKSVKLSLGTLQPQRAYDVKFTLELPQLTFANQSSGAIAGRLYLTSLAAGEDIDTSKITYQLSSDGGSNWSSVTPEDKSGYWLISGLTATQTYKIRAVYGGITTEPWDFTPATPSPVTSFTITHEYSSNVLTGSKVTVDGQNISYGDILNGLITERGVQVKNPSGTVVRTIKRNETGSISETTYGWPYLPQGSYTLEAYFKIGDETVVYDTIEATSPAPTFTVTVSGNTTYSYYTDLNKGAAAANNKTAENVFDVTSSISISEDILKNDNYTKPSVTYSVGGKTASSTYGTSKTHELNSEIGGLSWGSHNLTAVVTFDNCSVTSKEHPCVITGLPYTAAPPKIEGEEEHLWKFHNGRGESWSGNGSYAKIGNGASGESTITSSNFYVPSNISVSIAYNYYVKCDNFLGGKNVFTLNLGSKEVTSTTVKGANSTTQNGTTSTTMTASDNYLVCMNSYGLGTSHSKIYSIIVSYSSE